MFAVFAFYPIGTTAREKYHVKEIYLFGSYARGEADAQKVDIFEIREVNPDSDFYQTIMKEKVLVA